MVTNLYSQFFKDWYNKYRNKLLPDPLLWAIFTECVDRAWYSENTNPDTGLSQGEFFLSKQEYKKFGLKETQSNKISRKLDGLRKLWFLTKVNNKKGNNNASVYRLLPNDLLIPTRMVGNKSKIDSKKADNWLHTNKENNKREGKERESLTNAIQKIAEEAKQPFNTKVEERYIDLLLSDQFYSDVVKTLETKKTNQRWELIAKAYKAVITQKHDPFWKGKISDFKGLYTNFSKITGFFLSYNSNRW
jgi:hypothetical protein